MIMYVFTRQSKSVDIILHSSVLIFLLVLAEFRFHSQLYRKILVIKHVLYLLQLTLG